MSAVRRLPPVAAAALVFGASAAVLVIELVALRLLAPYLGLTLETTTFVIGTALTAIAVGSVYGGRVADRLPPHRTLAPCWGISGAVVALTPMLVRGAGTTADGTLVVVASLVTLFVPGALLSAVTPMVTKLRLQHLDETGTVVGRLSGIGTAGAIAGTILTGFVLISRVPVSVILVGLGIALVVAAAGLEWWLRSGRTLVGPIVLVALGGLGASVAASGCDVETTYHCAAVRPSEHRAGAQVLVLDNLRHSVIDTEDPEYLEFPYIRAMAAYADVGHVPGEPLSAYHLGGGGLTLPRYLAAVRPGTRSLVSEIDPGVVALDRRVLELDAVDGLEVRVEDARLGLREEKTGSRDLVVGDAFGGVSVPWHLTTLEAVGQIRRSLRADGAYVANLIDHGRLGFARAQVATLSERFAHVALASTPGTVAARPGPVPSRAGGNLVVVASDRPLDITAWQQAMDDRETGWTAITGEKLTAWVGDAVVLTDDYAPVDQLLTTSPRLPSPW